jgi:DNA-binding NarL/FixJ family response regulator
MATRVLIADDDRAIRRLLRRIVEEHPGWEVCGEAENGHDAIDKAGALAPDIAVLDLAMPQMNGLEAAREICKVAPLLPMLLLTVQEVSPALANEARKAGFQGAVSKSTGLEVVRGIEILLQEKSFFQQSESDLPIG